MNSAKKLLKENKYLRQEAPVVVAEASQMVRQIKLTEAGQLQLLKRIELKDLSLEKINKMAERAVGSVRALLM